ncbi:neurotrypsin-like isoform X2 [Halichondria panicea]|uniref:neurotrypsin-like isoform X2 n=1 Tax=Halichondria panicea TaxID=6063 RepID=UPI00312BA1AE
MKIFLVLALSYIVSTDCQQDPIEDACEQNGDLRLAHNKGDNYGALQICDSQYGWTYITPAGWTQAAARLACRKLNLGYNMNAASGSLRLSSDVYIFRIRQADCVEDQCKLYNCIEYEAQKQTAAVTINCIDCTDGAMRLVGGSTVSEGRLEICHNGQWGTICNQGWTDRRAAQVCSRLGLPTYNATLHQFNGGAGSVYTYNCTTIDSDISNCIQESSCAHSMDAGVKCLPFTDACAVPVDKVIATSGTSGALIGLLAAALVVVVTGWIVSCVYFQRKINKDHTHSTLVSTNNHTLQHTPQDETLYDTINDTVTNLEHNDTVQCVQNESYSLVGQRNMDK